MRNLPEGYFCPKCNAKATHDMVEKMRKDGMPSLYIVAMAMNILNEAHCPKEIMTKISAWAEKYRTTVNGQLTNLSEEEMDKLGLLAWKRSACSRKETDGL